MKHRNCAVNTHTYTRTHINKIKYLKYVLMLLNFICSIVLSDYLREGIEEVPGEGKHGNSYGKTTDNKPAVHQPMVLCIGQLFCHHLDITIKLKIL